MLKAVVAQYDAGELITQRENVSRKVREALVERAAYFGIQLDDVAITHLAFSPEYTQSIESKQGTVRGLWTGLCFLLLR